ncbi:ABC transporter F family member 4-like [Lolium rigidum]|uniref:ABC transporter F family member 4-like n=1 Tax=Lolium rigidum TaxID=89674 RepID=UPI001F5D3F61|nr:ABC transporter F family member 4-like [Lolium rigidum]
MVRDGNRNGKKKRSNVDEKAESAETLPSAAAAGKVPTKGRLSTSTTRDSRGDNADNNKVTDRSRTAAKSGVTVDEKPSKPKPASTRPATSNPYLAGVDLPPSESDSDDDDDEAAERRRSRATVDLKAAALSKKDALRKERREAEAAARAEAAKREALRDNLDAFAVTIRGRAPGGPAATARDIVLEDFDVSVEGVPLFVGASLRVSHGRRYGLVGPNGKGKSALLKLLAEGRKLPVPRGIRSTLVAQEDKNDDPRPVIEVVLAADEELARLRAERAELEGSGDAARLAEVYEELSVGGWDSATARASKILAGLGFDQDKQARPASSFSGGWVKRITLAGALFVQPTLLLLDEPTNHLDLRAVLWLEEYLVARCKSTVIVVSHDQDFLNSVCDEIIHLHDKKLHAYRGNFDDFEKAARKSRRRKPSNNKAMCDDYSVEFHFPAPDELPRRRPLLQLSEAGFRYPDFTLSGVDVDVYMGTRAAIVGPNGAGKSTLLKLLSGELSPTQGKVRTHHKLRTGRYSQRFVDTLKLHHTAVQHLLEAHPDLDGDEAEASAALAEFGLPSESHLTPINRLSGGQKARVVLASMALEEPHVLLLDEPTNHLDMQTIDALADALCEFAGGVVLVSHDSRLISRVCDDEESSEVWVVQDGTVSTYHGTFEEYKEELMQEIREEVQG